MKNRIAVCSWSLQATNAAELVERVLRVGVKYVQLALSPVVRNPDAWANVGSLLRDAGIEVISGMVEPVGEDYTSLESIRLTGGIVPDKNWSENWEHFLKITELARSLKLSLVTFHAGFVPNEPQTEGYQKLRDRIQQIAAMLRDNGMTLGLETGQETAQHLRVFLDHLHCPNVRVNYDPANILLYGNGDPIQVIGILAPYIYQCHLKDAVRTKVPGTWGTEVTVGTGEVDWTQFFTRLKEIGFKGDFSLEREAGNQRIEDLVSGRKLAEEIMAKL